MKEIKKVVITAGGIEHRSLVAQALIDRDGRKKTILEMLLQEAVRAGIEELGIVISQGHKQTYLEAAGAYRKQLTLIEQKHPRGYGHAVLCAQPFVRDQPFLQMIGDHLFLSTQPQVCARQLLDIAQAEQCSVSAVQTTRERNLPLYGTIGGVLIDGPRRIYDINTVIEKPTPTEAEQRLRVPGLRAGYYLCFFGMHVFTPAIFTILDRQFSRLANARISLPFSPALAELAVHERYVAHEIQGERYNIGEKYGLLMVQLALAAGGPDREEILTGLIELLARNHSNQAQPIPSSSTPTPTSKTP